MLLVLGIGVACAMAWYILVGHNWNQAATHIDDMVGSMDGYTVVMFDGVVKRPKEQPEKGRGAESSESPNSRSADSSQASKSSQSAKSQPPKVNAKLLAADYESKGAETIQVDMKSLWKYEEPLILKRSGKRFGIFSSSGPYRVHVTSVRAKIRYLTRHKVDFIILLADDRSMLSDKIAGADLLLLSKGGGLPGRGDYRGSLFCVDSPYVGEAQSVIISPSLVMTSQTVREL